MRRLRGLHATYIAYRDDRRNLVTFFGLTLSEQFLGILVTWFIAWGLRVEVSILYIAGVVPLACLLIQLPISIGNFGVYEGIFMLLMSLVGVSPSQAIAITLVGRILETVAWLPWYVAFAVSSGRLRPSHLMAEETRA
jgi:uncharacterized protein (TIRG00374 family)